MGLTDITMTAVFPHNDEILEHEMRRGSSAIDGKVTHPADDVTAQGTEVKRRQETQEG